MQLHFIYRQTSVLQYGSATAATLCEIETEKHASARGHMRITILSTKTGPGNNSKQVLGTQILSAK